jgi:hypothetical protein
VAVRIDNSGATPNYEPNQEVRMPSLYGIVGGIDYPASIYSDSPRFAPFHNYINAKIDGIVVGSSMNQGPVASVRSKTTYFPNGSHNFTAESWAGDYPTLIAVSPTIPVNVQNTIRFTDPNFDGQIYTGIGSVMIPFTARLYFNGYAKVEFWAELYNGTREKLSSQTVVAGRADYGAQLTIDRANAGKYTGVWVYALKAGQTTPDPLDRDVRYFQVAFQINSGGSGGGGGRFLAVRSADTGDFAASNVTILSEAEAKALSDAGEAAVPDPGKIQPFHLVYVSANGPKSLGAALIEATGERLALDAAVPDEIGSFTIPAGATTWSLMLDAAGLGVSPADLQLLKINGDARTAVSLAWAGTLAQGELGEGTYVVSAAAAQAKRLQTPLSVKIGANPSAHPVLRVVAGSDVRIDLFNAAGELVAQHRAAPGALEGGDTGVLYTVDLPSDAYVARVADAGGATITAKILVVR